VGKKVLAFSDSKNQTQAGTVLSQFTQDKVLKRHIS